MAARFRCTHDWTGGRFSLDSPTCLVGLVDLDGDGRDVLLTLARAHRAVETGEIVSKGHAAGIAAKRVDAAGAELLRAAAREYRGEEQVDWDRESSQVSDLAQSLIKTIRRTSAAP